jgi:hypothetical protein
MSGVSHADMIGIVLFLILGAVSYYFYTRISQLERKVGLMENILFDLKMTTEQAVTLMTDAPEGASKPSATSGAPPPKFTPTLSSSEELDHDDSHNDLHDSDGLEVLPTSSDAETRELMVDSSSRSRSTSQPPVQVEREHVPSSSASVTPNYEAMTYKELGSLARQKGISGLRNLSKAQVIDAIRLHDSASSGGQRPKDLTSWMQDSTPLDQQSSSQDISSANDDGLGGTPLDASEVDASFVSS